VKFKTLCACIVFAFTHSTNSGRQIKTRGKRWRRLGRISYMIPFTRHKVHSAVCLSHPKPAGFQYSVFNKQPAAAPSGPRGLNLHACARGPWVPLYIGGSRPWPSAAPAHRWNSKRWDNNEHDSLLPLRSLSTFLFSSLACAWCYYSSLSYEGVVNARTADARTLLLNPKSKQTRIVNNFMVSMKNCFTCSIAASSNSHTPWPNVPL
jgi:hypothetical protein